MTSPGWLMLPDGLYAQGEQFRERKHPPLYLYAVCIILQPALYDVPGNRGNRQCQFMNTGLTDHRPVLFPAGGLRNNRMSSVVFISGEDNRVQWRHLQETWI